jgi:hypothetical protein
VDALCSALLCSAHYLSAADSAVLLCCAVLCCAVVWCVAGGWQGPVYRFMYALTDSRFTSPRFLRFLKHIDDDLAVKYRSKEVGTHPPSSLLLLLLISVDDEADRLLPAACCMLHAACCLLPGRARCCAVLCGWWLVVWQGLMTSLFGTSAGARVEGQDWPQARMESRCCDAALCLFCKENSVCFTVLCSPCILVGISKRRAPHRPSPHYPLPSRDDTRRLTCALRCVALRCVVMWCGVQSLRSQFSRSLCRAWAVRKRQRYV